MDYRGFTAAVAYDPDRARFVGEVPVPGGVLRFEAEDEDDLRLELETAVDQYLAGGSDLVEPR